MSIATDIADAVVTEINGAPGGTFDIVFTAERKALPRVSLEDLADLADDSTLAVTVTPKLAEISNLTRANSLRDISIDIGVQGKIAPHEDLDETVASFGTLADQIVAYMVRRRLSDVPTVLFHHLTQDPVYALDHLDELRVFTTVLTATYRGTL